MTRPYIDPRHEVGANAFQAPRWSGFTPSRFPSRPFGDHRLSLTAALTIAFLAGMVISMGALIVGAWLLEMFR
jgi:hypothetical protein